ncbi:hypothetical protein SDC9_185150 [bioreactor metagenome]|uniref:Uncharacterized protein n=1 Tax=bioreactor metagenome TaxID=1076179 RepID=A0A645HFW6_9ZZZZ
MDTEHFFRAVDHTAEQATDLVLDPLTHGLDALPESRHDVLTNVHNRRDRPGDATYDR